MTTRRGFINAAAGAAALSVITEGGLGRVQAAERRAAGRSPEEIAADEDYWRGIQQAFAVDRTIINLNNGGVSPSASDTHEALKRYLDRSNECPVYAMWEILEPHIESVRQGLARAFGCDPEEMAITRNASESLETCIYGLDLKPGDEVLTTNQDYGRMLNTWRQRERREGLVLRTISFPTPPPSLDDLAERFERAITPKTRVILVCHITNLTGQIFPIRRIAELGRERGIPVIVDGAHAFAHFPFERKDLECDYYGTSLHKWLLAPIGTGFLYVRKEKIPALWPLMAAPDRMDDDIRKYEEIGTHPAANHNAIAEALTFHNGIGVERKAARLGYLRDRWAKRLRDQPGVRLLTSLEPGMSGAIATVNLDGVDPRALKQHLWQSRRVFVVPIVHEEFQGIRVTPNIFTTLDEVDVFAEEMERVIQHGLPA
jgi:selenocysteine lyase/cysteine desulfurase